MALNIIITNAGRAEIIAAENTGTNKVTIAAVALGTGRYAPQKSQTALQAEVKRVVSIAGKAVADDTIHVMALDESDATYNVGEFGLISDKGTLIAIYSQLPEAGWIIQKAPASTLLLATDIILESLGTATIQFGDITFINPPATVETPGVVQLEHSLTSASKAKALTAAMGKKLQDEKQPLDATLTALAALNTAADRLIYSTGPDQFALATLSAFMRTLLDDPNAATALTTLGAAPLNSPGFTGLPTAPTPSLTVSNNQLATTAFVQAAVAALVDSSPAALDTLKELASALGNDPNFATTMTNALAQKLALAGGNVSGYINMQQNISGGYGVNSGSGTGWGATLWGMGPAYSGGEAGANYAPSNLFGVAWLRDGHAANTFAGEGLYLYQAGSQYAGMGSSGFWTSGSYTGKGTGLTDIPQSGVSGLVVALAAKAALNSPAFNGTPTAPTPPLAVSNNQIATTAFVQAAVAALVDSSPAALDTLKELASALGNDPNFATTVTNALASKQPLSQFLTDLVTSSGWGTGAQAVSTETDLDNYRTGGKFVTPASGLVGLPSGWAQGRHVIDVSGGVSYACQKLMGAGANKGLTATRAWDGNTYTQWFVQWNSGNFDPDNILPPGFITGLTFSNSGASPSTDIIIAPGAARSVDDGASMRLAAPITRRLQTSGTWLSGNPGNGLFTGARTANTWYHLFLVRNPTTGMVDAGFDTSITAANRPAAWTQYRRLGSFKTDGSGNIIPFVMDVVGGRRRFKWVTPVMEIDAATIATTAVAYALSVPPGLKVLAELNPYFWANNAVVHFSPLDTTDIAPQLATGFTGFTGGITAITDSSTDGTAQIIYVMTNTAGQIRARGNRSMSISMLCLGWEE